MPRFWLRQKLRAKIVEDMLKCIKMGVLFGHYLIAWVNS